MGVSALGHDWTQQAKLTAKVSATEEIGKGEYGTSVSISATGEYALIGAPGDNSGIGAAWVSLRTGTTWAQQGAKLVAKSGEETGDGAFGYSVAISAEKGEYALIGAFDDKEGIGAAWVFLRSSTTWTQQGAKLVPKSGEEIGSGSFGRSVAISAKGEYALMGAPDDNAGVGGAWVFLRSSTTWTQQGAKLVAKSGEEIGTGEFGYSVAIASKEGNYALIGAPGDKEGVGAAWVFLRTTTTWAQQGAKLTGSGETGVGNFGASVALSSEGTYALMGGFADHSEVGAAWVFLRSGTTWAQQGEKLTGKEEIREGEASGKGELGYSVALAPGGEYALIGGPSDSKQVGAAWVFLRTGTTWAQQAKLTAKSGEEIGAGEFGQSVALSEKGEYALVGSPGDKEGIGGAFVFLRSGTTWAQQGAKLVAKSGEEIGAGSFGKSVSISAKGEYALIGSPSDKEDIGGAFVFLRSGTTWAQQGAKLVAKSGEETGAGEFGASVAIAAKEGNYALIGAPSDKEGIGAAWVYLRTSTTWAQQGAKLVPKSGEESGTGEFGKSVAISAAGEYALMGSPGDKEGIGGAYVFLRSSTTWTQQGAKLVAKSGEETGDGEFGSSVAIGSEKGEYALFGAPGDNAGVGAAWVFLRSSTTWTQQGTKLTGSGENGPAEFGKNVALSATGEYALMGAPRDSKEIGATWVFLRSGTTWTQQGEKLIAKEEYGEGEILAGRGAFGYSVALSAEGNTALIGGPAYNLGQGAAWVFTRTGSTWTQQGTKLTGSGEVGAAEFGDNVSLSSTGTTALIGGFRDNAAAGAVWVFTRSGSTWTQQGEKLTAKAGEEIGPGEFGESVALSSEGTTTYAIIGSPGEDYGIYYRYGGAYVFTRTGSTWTQQGEKIQNPVGEVEEGEFGYSLALNSEGSTALIGGPGDNKDVGALWTFTRSGSTWAQQGEKFTASGEIGAGELGFSLAMSPSGKTALVGAPSDNTDVGAAWPLTYSGSAWTQAEKLTGTGEVGAGQFGYDVALSANGNIALMGGPNDNLNVGAAWVFAHTGTTWSQQGSKLTGAGAVGEGWFGDSVALSSEGNTAIIGGFSDNREVGAAMGVREQRPDRRNESALAGSADDGDPQREREPRRPRSHQMRIRIRHDDLLRIDRGVRLAAGLREQRGGRVRSDHGADGEHHLPRQDLGDERGRHDQRL